MGPILIAIVAGATVAWVVWRSVEPTLAQPVFERENYRGHRLPTGAGIVIAVTVVVTEAVVTALDVLGLEVAHDTIGPRRLTVLAVIGFALLGLLDDLAGVGDSGGFRGHVRALAGGRLTTGAIKLFGGAALAIVVVAAGTEGLSFARLLADAALVALAANLGNLFDRAPGRVAKLALLLFVALLIATGAPDELAGTAAVAGAIAVLLVPDLRERMMLGDAGANAAGAALGVGVVATCSPAVRTAVLVAVLALNVASEVVSFSAVIDRVAPLRRLDQLGRLRPRDQP